MSDQRRSEIESIRVCIKAAEFHPQVKPTKRATAALDSMIAELRALREQNAAMLPVVRAAIAWNECTSEDDPAISRLSDEVDAFKINEARAARDEGKN